LSEVYIPVSLFAEKDGTFTNFEGRVQSLNKAVDNGVISDLEFLALLSARLGVNLPKGIDEVQDLIRKEVPLYNDVDFNGGTVKYPFVLDGAFALKKVSPKGKGKFKVFPGSLRLHSGSFTRRSQDLSRVYAEPAVEINPTDASKLNVGDGDYIILKFEDTTRKFRVAVVKGMPDGVVSLPNDFKETADLFHKGKYLKVDLVKHNG
jgi:formate dehydrogenase major subunit/NADH-quinone oxidoreductase subunit G